MNAPTITLSEDFDTDEFTLMATSYLRTEPAGPRLFRGGDLPAIKFVHTDEAEARKGCAALQRYCDLAWAGKAPRAKGREEAEQPKLTKFDFANAVWTL